MYKLKQLRFLLNRLFSQIFIGRNGFDNLATTCSVTALLLLIINIFAQSIIIYILWVALFGYSLFRVYSKNITKRYAENQKFLSLTKTPASYINLMRLQIRDRKTSRYYICKNCHQQIRVPKGKGRIEIRCPKCSNRFVKKT